jgi:hypothetical protein
MVGRTMKIMVLSVLLKIPFKILIMVLLVLLKIPFKILTMVLMIYGFEDKNMCPDASECETRDISRILS